MVCLKRMKMGGVQTAMPKSRSMYVMRQSSWSIRFLVAASAISYRDWSRRE